MTPSELILLYERNLDKDSKWGYGIVPNFFTGNLLNGCSKEELDVIREHIGDKIAIAKSTHQRTNLSKIHSTLD